MLTSVVFQVVVVIFFAAFTQGATGFGFALVSMPLLVGVIGMIPAAALVSLMAFCTQIIMVWRYGKFIEFSSVWRVMLASIFGIVIGVRALLMVDERIILSILGAFLMMYSLYALFSPKMPELKNPRWGYLIGLLSGILGGAYNTSGPPLVVYAVSKQWEPAVYKGNLQAMLQTVTAVTILFRFQYGQYTMNLLPFALAGIGAIILGANAGFLLDRYIDARRFRQVVLVFLFIIGLRILLTL